MNPIKVSLLKLIGRFTFYFSRDSLSANILAPLYTTYLPWSSASMQPNSVTTILNDIIINKRKMVVECGSGISTYFIAKILRKYGGRLISIDHDQDWLLTLTGILEAEDLLQVVDFIHAPLVCSELSLDNGAWYDTAVLDQHVKDKNDIDLLIVDGPPANDRLTLYSRYPALPYFYTHLNRSFSIFLHDIVRKPEREIISRWEKEYHLAFAYRFLDGNFAMAMSDKRYAV